MTDDESPDAAPPAAKRSRRRRYNERLEQDKERWREVDDQLGVRLIVRKARWNEVEIQDAAGTTLATGRPDFNLPGRGPKTLAIAGGPEYARRLIRKSRFDTRAYVQYVDTATDEAILKVRGVHRNRRANTQIQLLTRPSQPTMTLPVSGRRLNVAIMTAVTDKGIRWALFRRVNKDIDVILEPGVEPNSETLLFVAEAAPAIVTYFQTSGGGG